MKVAIAQITTTPGEIKKNTAKIISYIRKARKAGANLVIFPELCIPGYLSMDLFLYPDFIHSNQESLHQIAPFTKGITAIIGFVDEDCCRLGPDGTHLRYNSAAVIQNGRILGIEDKTLLPDYDIFDENRYFQSARGRRVYSCAGQKFGVEICEDLWDEHYPTKVTRELVKKGAEVIVNISASPFYLGKYQIREKLIAKVAARYHVPFIYTNLVGSFDGYEGQLVFDGRSLVVSSGGKPVKRGVCFREQLLVVDLNSRHRPQVFNDSDSADLYEALVLGIREFFKSSGFDTAFIGLSGGIDSAVVAALTSSALGAKNVTGVSLPSGLTSHESIEDARQLAKNLGINFKIVPIAAARDVLFRELSFAFSRDPSDLTNQNIQARLRGIILMGLANESNSLLVTTGNKTETSLGYCTLYGDMAGAIAPISDVDKLRVYELAEYINRRSKQPIIPVHTITRPPTAELSQNQSDEAGLGAPYSQIVPIVNNLIRGGTINQLSKKHPRFLVEKYWSLVRRSEHKRRQAAPGIKVTDKAFGIGRRIPINHSFIK